MFVIITSCGCVVVTRIQNHAKYGEYAITVELNASIVDGRFPKRALNHVLEWVELHRSELLEDWALAQAGKKLYPIAPLE